MVADGIIALEEEASPPVRIREVAASLVAMEGTTILEEEAWLLVRIQEGGWEEKDLLAALEKTGAAFVGEKRMATVEEESSSSFAAEEGTTAEEEAWPPVRSQEGR